MESVENTWARKFFLCGSSCCLLSILIALLTGIFHTLSVCSAFNTPTSPLLEFAVEDFHHLPDFFFSLIILSFLVFSHLQRVITRARLSLFLFPLERIINCVPSTQFNLRLIIYWHGKLICFLSTVALFAAVGRLRLLSTATLERFNKKQIAAGGKHGSDFFINTHIYTHSYNRPASMMNMNASLLKRARGSWWCPDYCQRWLYSTAD